MKGEGGVSNTWCQKRTGKGEERSSLAASLFLSSCSGAKFTFAPSLFSPRRGSEKVFRALHDVSIFLAREIWYTERGKV